MDLSAEDYVELLDLYGRSTQLIANGDAEGWAELFTSDGVFYVPAIERFGAPRTEIIGRDALRAYISKVISGANDEQMGLAPGTRKRHLCSNIVLDTDAGDGAVVTARGSAYFMLLVFDPTPRIFGSGSYDDYFQKEEEGWKIRRRNLTPEL